VLRVVEAGDIQPGDQIEFGNILLQAKSTKEVEKRNVEILADVVLADSMVSSLIVITMYKRLPLTVIGRAYESILEEEFLDPPIDWGGHWSLIHGISGCQSWSQSESQIEPRGTEYLK
jgi:hypothetical protein